MKHIYYYPTLSGEEVDELQKYIRQPLTKQEYKDLARFLSESAQTMPKLAVGLSPDLAEAMEEEYKYRMALCNKLSYLEMNMDNKAEFHRLIKSIYSI